MKPKFQLKVRRTILVKLTSEVEPSIKRTILKKNFAFKKKEHPTISAPDNKSSVVEFIKIKCSVTREFQGSMLQV